MRLFAWRRRDCATTTNPTDQLPNVVVSIKIFCREGILGVVRQRCACACVCVTSRNVMSWMSCSPSLGNSTFKTRLTMYSAVFLDSTQNCAAPTVFLFVSCVSAPWILALPSIEMCEAVGVGDHVRVHASREPALQRSEGFWAGCMRM